MAEFVDLSQQLDVVNESEFNSFISSDFLYVWLINYVLNFEEAGSISNERDPSVLQEKITLFEIANDLQDIIISLLEEKIKLIDIKNKVLVAKINFLEEIVTQYEDYSKNEDTDKKSVLQEYQSLIDSAINKFENKRKEILSEDANKVVEDTYEMFLKYREVYKKYEHSLKEILKHSEKKLDMSNVPRNCQEDLCILISILKENLTSCNSVFASSEKAFHDFESLIRNKLIVSDQKLNNKINLFMTTIEKVEFTYSEAFSIFFEILNLDCATRALY